MSSSSNYSSGAETLDLRYETLKCECGVRAAIRVTESNKPSKERLWLLDQRYPNATKFQRMPLQFTENLDIIFSDAATTGEWAYTPSSGVMPYTDETPDEIHTAHDAEFHDDNDLKVVHPFELNKKCPSNTNGSSTKSKTKKKFISAALLNKTLDRIVNMVESSSTTSTQSSSRYPSIAECLAKLESIAGVSPDDELYVWATRLFLRDKRRECFMTLPMHEVRLRFLKLEIEMKKTTTSHHN
ncbi:L10-interacting MYB domain-containing protein [Camellia lanceoleosa]|uniref:L10-interacting MYB domain-containing protein n=1 Tax=Camellia lanceoleosa TaxID=1840588 RepID=A0ACC0IIG3_9ERIC|nr:L10-interacting MYB domain-containing protein [Camellia lanceoleosa]